MPVPLLATFCAALTLAQTQPPADALAAPVFEIRVQGERLLPDAPQLDPTPTTSHYHLVGRDLDRTPGALEDISRVIQNLPGVVGDPDLLATFSVRGGAPSETLFYLDGVPLSNPYHLTGFATLYHPMLIDSAEFYAGGAPGRYAPSLSGVLDVRYADTVTSTPHVWADVSIESAKARVDVPLGVEGLSMTVAARRTFLELYFLALKALHVTGENYVAPQLSEYFARVSYRRGASELTATFLYDTDGLDFEAGGASPLLAVGQGLTLNNHFLLASLREHSDLPGGNALTLQLAFTRDLNHTALDAPSNGSGYVQDSAYNQVFASAEVALTHSERNRSRFGAQLTSGDQRFGGGYQDVRAQAPWETQPVLSSGLDYLDIHPRLIRNVFAAFFEHTYSPGGGFSAEASGRMELDAAHLRWTRSLRLAVSQAFDSGTVIKASGGSATQMQTAALLLDPTYGNPALGPEQVESAVVSAEQALPFGAVLRLEGYWKWLSHLVVNPDSPAALQALLASGQPGFQNRGTGQARGLDLLLLGKVRGASGQWSYGLSAGLLFADRINPLATEGPATYPAPYDQRFTLAANAAYAPGKDWVFTARFNFHTGRPYTAVEGFTLDASGTRYVPTFGAPNAALYPAYFEASIRAEKHFRIGPVRASWYVEVINVTEARNVFIYLYDAGNPAAGTPPQRGEFDQLPIRPFAGFRVEY